MADYLTKKGVPFRSAYKISGQLVAYCIAHDTVLEQLPLETYKTYSDVFEDDLYTEISLKTCVARRRSQGKEKGRHPPSPVRGKAGRAHFRKDQHAHALLV